MNEPTLKAIIDEISPKLIGQKFGRIFPLSKMTFAIDFRLNDGFYLFISIDSFSPRIYLITRRLRDLERQSINPHPFINLLRKRLANSIVEAISKDENERIVRFKLAASDEIEGEKNYTFVIQLTGRSANLFLLDERDFIIDSLRENQGDGQIVATKFASPVREPRQNVEETTFQQGDFATLSEALDHYYQQVEAEKLFLTQIKSAESKLKQEITKREKLKKKLLQDLVNHGEADRWKHLGDVILANLANAVRIDDTVLVVDYFAENAPTIEIEIDRNLGLTEAAEGFFKRYTKARNAKLELTKRIETINQEISSFELEQTNLRRAIIEKNLADFLPEEIEKKQVKNKDKHSEIYKGVRRYMSSDGLEISSWEGF